MSEADILEAFSGHPRIGDVKDLEKKYGSSPMEEQASVRIAKTRTLELLKVKNDEYLEKFGFIFIVFATGKTAEEMLGLLESRLGNSRETELENGAREQSLIFTKRLRQLLEVQ
jgi:2-oxo-4-hydroxy-4-carboxy-5-ureidoimidazoline decarboxylase